MGPCLLWPSYRKFPGLHEELQKKRVQVSNNDGGGYSISDAILPRSVINELANGSQLKLYATDFDRSIN